MFYSDLRIQEANKSNSLVKPLEFTSVRSYSRGSSTVKSHTRVLAGTLPKRVAKATGSPKGRSGKKGHRARSGSRLPTIGVIAGIMILIVLGMFISTKVWRDVLKLDSSESLIDPCPKGNCTYTKSPIKTECPKSMILKIEIYQYLHCLELEWDKEVAVAIVRAESGMNPNALNKNNNNTFDVGMWQINTVHKIGSVCSVDVECSTMFAYSLWKRRGGFQDWAAYNNGAYLKYLNKGII